MNKKAITFGVTLVIITLVVISVALYSFLVTQKKVLQNTLTAKEILEFEQEQTRLKIYAKKASNLAFSQALYIMAENSLIKNLSECLAYEDRLIWQESCRPQNLKEWFLEIFSEKFSELMKMYPKQINFSLAFVDDIIKIKIELEEKKNSSISYSFFKSFEIDLNFTEKINITELENLYQKLIDCKKNEDCLKKISLEKWDLKVEKYEDFFFIDVESKERHFINKAGALSFEKIKIKFAIFTENSGR